MLNLPLIHPTYVRLLCNVLQQRGISVATVLQCGGLSEAELARRRLPVGLSTVEKLVAASIEQSACPWLGLEYGAALPLSAHGPIGYATVASADLGGMLDVIARFGGVRLPAFGFAVLPVQEEVLLCVRERVPLGALRRFLLDAVAAAMSRLMGANLSSGLRGVTISFPWERPPWYERYQTVLPGAVVEFGAETLQWCFPRPMLSQPCLMSDESVTLDSALRVSQEDIPVSVQVAMRLAGIDTSYPSLEETAAQLHVSPRTLMRQLKAEDCSWQELLDESRKARALWWLRSTTQPVDAIAARLGFADTSNFSRTFRRWFGKTPTELRRAGSGGEGDLPGALSPRTPRDQI